MLNNIEKLLITICMILLIFSAIMATVCLHQELTVFTVILLLANVMNMAINTVNIITILASR